MTEKENASYAALKIEYDSLEAESSEANELPDEVDQCLGEIETAIAAFEDRPVRYDPAEIARAGIFASIDGEGALRIECGFIRIEDEAPVEPIEGSDGDAQRAVITIGGAPTGSSWTR